MEGTPLQLETRFSGLKHLEFVYGGDAVTTGNPFQGTKTLGICILQGGDVLG